MKQLLVFTFLARYFNGLAFSIPLYLNIQHRPQLILQHKLISLQTVRIGQHPKHLVSYTWDLYLHSASQNLLLADLERSRKFDYIFRLHIIQLSNARMMTFQSLLSQLNLKQLIRAIKQLRTRPTLPYYVLKLNSDSFYLPSDCALSITKKVSNSTLAAHQGPLTVWSSSHLHRISETWGDRPQKRIILKNPFKSQQLLWQALCMGVKEMLVDTRDELFKIQNFKSKTSQFKGTNINYIWSAQDHSQNILELHSVQQYISGLYIQNQSGLTNDKVDTIARKVLLRGAKIQEIIRQTKVEELSEIKQWKREQFCWRDRQIKKTIDLCDLSEVENHILVTRSLSPSKLIIHEQARQLVEGIDIQKNCLLVGYEKEQWLLSALKEFPMQQQKFLFQVQTSSRLTGKMPRPIMP